MAELSPLQEMVAQVGPEAVAAWCVERPGWEYDWNLRARPSQLPPVGHWRMWLLMAGRRWGKDYAASQFVRQCVERGTHRRVRLIGATAADVRDTMVEGPSGILSVFPPSQRPVYRPQRNRVDFHNGAIALTYSAQEPDRLRGSEGDLLWGDEVATWPDAQEVLDMALFGNSHGKDPKTVLTTTPKPVEIMLGLVKQAERDPLLRITKGTTYDNVPNLAPAYAAEIISKYEGTRLGRQELLAEMLEDLEGALWTYALLDGTRLARVPTLARVVVGVDPSAGDKPQNDEQGIVAAGLDEKGDLCVLEDATCKLTPDGWGRRAVETAVKWEAQTIVVERNAGGDMAKATIVNAQRAMMAEAMEKLAAERMEKIARVRIEDVTARKGKHVRAEPVAALWEQGRAHLCGPPAMWRRLENELTHFTPRGYEDSGSPNAADALVHAATKLMGRGEALLVLPKVPGVRALGAPKALPDCLPE